MAPDCFIKLGRINLDLLIPAFRNHADGELGHLSDFFFQRHALEQGFDLLRVITLWPSDANGVLKKQIAVVDVHFHWSSFVCLSRKGVHAFCLGTGWPSQGETAETASPRATILIELLVSFFGRDQRNNDPILVFRLG